MIRTMKQSDLSTVLKINQENVPAVGSETYASLDFIYSCSSVALVIEIDRQVVGYCLVLPPSTSYDSPNYQYFHKCYDHFIYLDRIAISSKYRNLGWGPKLYEEVVKRTEADWFTLEVNIEPPNMGSLRFHLREGFSEIAQEETRPGKIVSLMSKALMAR